ncbi:MAG: LysR family transcriptional regulator [Ramlibacter sp.]|nr:LysR family transcriptional regulator [Ramlibacter sp.]
MDHKWLEDFVTLAAERSFSRAAELRHVTQPQFSRRIRALELWAGTDLVNRAGMPLELTAAGQEFLGVARRAVESLGHARARIRHAQGGLEGITLATGRSLALTAVPDWLDAMTRAAGAFRLRMMTGSVHDGVLALEQGGADFLLSFAHPRLPLVLDEKRFEGVTVGHDQLVAVCSPAVDGRPRHPLPGSPGAPVRWLGYTPSLALNQILQDGLSRAARDLHLQTVVESDFADFLHEQALRGTGLAWLPQRLVGNDLRDGRLVRADTEGAEFRFEIRLYHPREPRSELARQIWAASQRA